MTEFSAALIGAIVGGVITLAGIAISNRHQKQLLTEELQHMELTSFAERWWQRRYDLYVLALTNIAIIHRSYSARLETFKWPEAPSRGYVDQLRKSGADAEDALANAAPLFEVGLTTPAASSIAQLLVVLSAVDGPRPELYEQAVSAAAECRELVVKQMADYLINDRPL